MAKEAGGKPPSALAEAKYRIPRPSPDDLATMLGDALERWPEDWEPGERDEVSHIIHRLDEIAGREAKGRR